MGFLGYGSPEALEEAIKKSEGEQDDVFVIYASGLVLASVCSSLPQDEVEKRMKQVITGTRAGWCFAKGESFADGEPKPSPCNEPPKTHNHYLIQC